MRFLQEAFCIMNRITVPTAITRIHGKMLGCGDNSQALKVLDKAHAHISRQTRIFAIRFLHASPAYICRQIDNRRKNLAYSPTLRFHSNRMSHPAHQSRIKCCRQGNRLRESRSSTSYQAMQGFVKNNRRNAQTRFFHKITLNLIDLLYRFGSRQFRIILKHLAHLRIISSYRRNLKAKDSILKPFFTGIQIARHHINLPELFFDGHSLQQVIHSFLYRKIRILIRELFGLYGNTIPPKQAYH